MIISDGTTNLTFTGTKHDDFIEQEKSTNTSAGGRKKSQTSGRRFIVVEGVRVTMSEWQSLIELLTNKSDEYFYTPTNIPAYLTAADFPMAVNIDAPTKTRQVGGGEKRFYIEMSIEGVSYL